jgi:type IV pilus assembly protein PilC
MALYKYKAFNEHGEPVEGEVEANTAREAIMTLRGSGYEVTSTQLVPQERPEKAPRKPLTWNELHQLNSQMLMIAKGGLPLAPSIAEMAKDLRNPRLKAVLDDIRLDLEMGRTLDEAFSRHQESFSPVYLATLRAGERTGNLAKVFLRLTEYSKNILEVRISLQTVMTYPAIVATISLFIIVFLLVKVVPVFAEIFRDFGGRLPAPTQLLVSMSDVLVHNTGSLAGCVVAFILICFSLRFLARRNSAAGYFFDFIISHLPIIGRLIVRASMMRFCGTLRLLLEAKMPLPECLGLAAAAAGNAVLADRVGRVSRDIARGVQFSQALSNARYFDHGFCWLMENAEKQDNLCGALAILEEDYGRNLKQIQTIIIGVVEPIMIITVGFAIGFIVLALYLPIFSLGDAIN